MIYNVLGKAAIIASVMILFGAIGLFFGGATGALIGGGIGIFIGLWLLSDVELENG